MAFGDDTVLQNRERLSETVKCILPSWRELASEEFEETHRCFQDLHSSLETGRGELRRRYGLLRSQASVE